ncbi:hypothetical protein GCM10027168_45000 [Streptomyces capparidis]
MEGEQWPEEVPDRQVGVAPVVLVRLHDGQLVDAAVLARILQDDGTWWYRLAIDLPMRVQGSDGRLTCEPCPWEFEAPADRVTARPGQDYSTVPTHRSPAALRQARPRRHRRGTRPAAGNSARPAPPPPTAVTAAAAGNAPPPPPALRPAPPRARAAEAPWRLETLHRPADYPGVRQLLHRAGCWAAARTTTPLTEDEQARLRGQAHVGLCDTCTAGSATPAGRA